MQSTAPFFSNDLQGTFKILGVFGSMLLVIVGVIVKWGQSAFKEKLDKVAGDLEGLGRKVDALDKSCIAQTTKSGEDRERLARAEINIGVLQKEQGQSEATTSALEKQVNGLQGAMLITMNDQLGERDEKLTKLEVTAGRLDERLNMADLIRRYLGNPQNKNGES